MRYVALASIVMGLVFLAFAVFRREPLQGSSAVCWPRPEIVPRARHGRLIRGSRSVPIPGGDARPSPRLSPTVRP